MGASSTAFSVELAGTLVTQEETPDPDTEIPFQPDRPFFGSILCSQEGARIHSTIECFAQYFFVTLD